MKAKMGEIDGKMAIYRRNLGQNSRWNTNLSLKFKSGRWITLLTLESHLGRWINAGVIWSVRSRWREERNISKKSAIYRRNISDLSAIFCGHRRFFGEIADLSIFTDISSIYWRFFAKNRPSIFLLEMPCRHLPIQDISAIYRRYFPIFSSMPSIRDRRRKA